jgi:hypothetical protein
MLKFVQVVKNVKIIIRQRVPPYSPSEKDENPNRNILRCNMVTTVRQYVAEMAARLRGERSEHT